MAPPTDRTQLKHDLDPWAQPGAQHGEGQQRDDDGSARADPRAGEGAHGQEAEHGDDAQREAVEREQAAHGERGA